MAENSFSAERKGVGGERKVEDRGAEKKKRFFGSKGKRPQSIRRACTPEPGRVGWTDESEKDVSEAEVRERPPVTPRKSRASKVKDDAATRRTRSAERAPVHDDEDEIDEDFELIRKKHISKQMEEEKEQKTETDVKAKVVEPPKAAPVKEMPPLIIAPPELRKRVRHKCQEVTKEQLILSKPKEDRRKLSTSEEEDTIAPANIKSRKIKGDLPESERRVRRLRRVTRKEKTEASESEGRSSDRPAGGEEESDVESNSETEKPTAEAVKVVEDEKMTFFSKLFCWVKTKKEKCKEESEVVKEAPEVPSKPEAKQTSEWVLSLAMRMWKEHVLTHPEEYKRITVLKNQCLSHLVLVMLYCGFGGMIFRFVEGAFESFYKCGVKRVKRDFIDGLWGYSQYMLEEDWKSQARRKLMEFENQLHAAHEAGMTTYSGQKSWSFLNSVVYCLTVITTIGYGHISPSTNTGRAITIIYAIFGIPMFLILLADFGKLFTRCIKFLWAFVRRLYYTGSCKKVRGTAPVQEMMKGVQMVYDFAKNRRPSQWVVGDHQHNQSPSQLHVPENTVSGHPETPGTPNLSAFEIDDEFNLPISVAIVILVIYIFVGATIYWMWENWSFFESFYFVFISMSTIGFGDFVPQNPVYMMASIIYLVFGLALTSMCINVVQEKLTDTFRQASTKIGATIGLRVSEDGTLSAPAELADANPLGD